MCVWSQKLAPSSSTAMRIHCEWSKMTHKWLQSGSAVANIWVWVLSNARNFYWWIAFRALVLHYFARTSDNHTLYDVRFKMTGGAAHCICSSSSLCIVIGMRTNNQGMTFPSNRLRLAHTLGCNFLFAHRNLSPFIRTVSVDAAYHLHPSTRMNAFSPKRKRSSKMENNASQHLSSGTENITFIARSSVKWREKKNQSFAWVNSVQPKNRRQNILREGKIKQTNRIEPWQNNIESFSSLKFELKICGMRNE